MYESKYSKVLSRCITCLQAKFKVMSHGLYTPILITSTPWVDISMNFVFGISRNQRGFNSIFVVVDHFSKMTHLIPCHNVDDASYISGLFFKRLLDCMVYQRLECLIGMLSS